MRLHFENWNTLGRRRQMISTLLATAFAVTGMFREATAVELVNASNSAIGASSSMPDPAHFQNAGIMTERAVYVGHDSVNGIGYMDNTGTLTTTGTGGGDFDTTGNWGLGVGIFPGGEGYFINSGAGTVHSVSEIRVGDGFDGGSYGEFHQQSSGDVTADTYLTVGNFGGSGKFVQSGTGAVNVGYELWIGTGTGAGGSAVSHGEYSITNSAAQLNTVASTYVAWGGGSATFTQNGGSVTIGVAGQEEVTPGFGYYQELFIGWDGATTNGQYDLNAGDLTVNGWTNIGRDGAIGEFNNSGTFTTTRELRIAADYNGAGGSATVNNLAGSVIDAQHIYLGYGFGAGATGTLNVAEGSTVTTNELDLGRPGQGFLNQEGGDVVVNSRLVLGFHTTATGTYVMDGGTLTSSYWIHIGWEGVGDFTQNGGEIIAGNVGSGGGAFGIGYWGTSVGNKFTQNHGSLTVVNDWYVVGILGQGDSTQLNDSTIEAAVFALGQYYDVDFSVPGVGTHTMNAPDGSITIHDWTYIGLDGTGILNMQAGEFSAGDNFSIGLGGTGVGQVNMTGGKITVMGNAPAYTGNFIVGRHGSGTLNMSSGVLDMITGDTGTNNAASYSVVHYDEDPDEDNPLALARDGNLLIAEQAGTGVADFSGDAIVNVAANVFVGGINTNTFQGGNGTLTIREDAEVRVGLTSPTGGDLVLGSPVASVAVVNLQGGLLDVTRTDDTGDYGGRIGAGGSGSSITFSFIGGTLKTRVWNAPNPLFGGDLGSLVQNGIGSLLDVTGNDTDILSDYDLGEGTATIGTGYTLTADNVINSAGLGVINVGTGPGYPDGDFNLDGIVNAVDYVVWRDTMASDSNAYNTWKQNFAATGGGGPAVLTVGGGTIDVDVLNLNNGTVTAGGIEIDVELTGNGTINGDTVVNGIVSPGSSAGTLTFDDDLTLSASSTLEIEIGGSVASLFDSLDVSGALLGLGTLNVTLIDGFIPTNVGDLFQVLTVDGTFTNSFTVTASSGSGTWEMLGTGQLKYNGGATGSGFATSVPEPASFALACGVFAMLFVAARRRQAD